MQRILEGQVLKVKKGPTEKVLKTPYNNKTYRIPSLMTQTDICQ